MKMSEKMSKKVTKWIPKVEEKVSMIEKQECYSKDDIQKIKSMITFVKMLTKSSHKYYIFGGIVRDYLIPSRYLLSKGIIDFDPFDIKNIDKILKVYPFRISNDVDIITYYNLKTPDFEKDVRGIGWDLKKMLTEEKKSSFCRHSTKYEITNPFISFSFNVDFVVENPELSKYRDFDVNSIYFSCKKGLFIHPTMKDRVMGSEFYSENDDWSKKLLGKSEIDVLTEKIITKKCNFLYGLCYGHIRDFAINLLSKRFVKMINMGYDIENLRWLLSSFEEEYECTICRDVKKNTHVVKFICSGVKDKNYHGVCAECVYNYFSDQLKRCGHYIKCHICREKHYMCINHR
jgi:hypothetical protein